MAERLLFKKRINFYNHMSAAEIIKLIGRETWDQYYTFSMERNPFDKMVSLYYWRGGDERYGNFKNFLLNGGLKKFRGYDTYALDGVVAVDKIYRQEDIPGMCCDLGEKLSL